MKRRLVIAGCLLFAACSAGDEQRGTRGNDGSGSGAAQSGSGGSDDFGNANGPRAGSAGAPPVISSDGGPGGPTCASVRAGAELAPVYLAFAFDVSGSMGKGDEPWHDKSLKWDPVVAATRAFFEDPASTGLNASLTFFPADGDEDERCVQGSYESPDVDMTGLPSSEFGSAIDEIEPQNEDDWRGGTPTLFVVQGTRAFIEERRQSDPGRYALVLVTDGYPQGCDDEDDEISVVVDEVAAAHEGGVDSYVIGVANPPVDDAPDTVTDLNDIAAAGGTDHAYLIDTGDPAMTSAAFSAAIEQIRGSTFSCDIPIPAPPDGRTFDKEKIAVSYTRGGGAATALSYSADCSGAQNWHFDDPADPKVVVLCDETCNDLQAGDPPELSIEFSCEQQLDVD